MDERTLHTGLTQLIEEIEKLPEYPSKKSKKASSKTAVSKDLTISGKSTEEMIDYLRLQIKYMVFDLEATRRENNYLRKMLDTRPPHADGGHEGF